MHRSNCSCRLSGKLYNEQRLLMDKCTQLQYMAASTAHLNESQTLACVFLSVSVSLNHMHNLRTKSVFWHTIEASMLSTMQPPRCIADISLIASICKSCAKGHVHACARVDAEGRLSIHIPSENSGSRGSDGCLCL